MKKLLPIIFSIIVLPAFSQITITSADIAQIGDVINRKADTLTPITGPGPAGANQSWVMTNLSQYVNDENTSVVSVGSTPYAAQFPNSNIAMTNDNASYIYVNNSSSIMTTQGGAGDLLMLGTTIVAPLNPDLTLHNFPRTYNSTYTDTYKTDVTINGSVINPLVSQVRYKRVGTVTDVTDGWGTITTPVGTYDVLRVKRSDHAKDTIWILPVFPPTWSVFSTKDDTSYSYQWLGNNMKLAVAELNYDSLDQPKTFKWTLTPPPSTVSVNENSTNENVQIFPVPVSDNLNLRFGNDIETGEYYFSVYDITGKVLLQKLINGAAAGTYTISVGELAPGFYTWQLADRKQTSRNTGKFNVVR